MTSTVTPFPETAIRERHNHVGQLEITRVSVADVLRAIQSPGENMRPSDLDRAINEAIGVAEDHVSFAVEIPAPAPANTARSRPPQDEDDGQPGDPYEVAEQNRLQLKEYWAEKRFRVRADLREVAPGRFVVVSDMVNGMPKRMHVATMKRLRKASTESSTAT